MQNSSSRGIGGWTGERLPPPIISTNTYCMTDENTIERSTRCDQQKINSVSSKGKIVRQFGPRRRAFKLRDLVVRSFNTYLAYCMTGGKIPTTNEQFFTQELQCTARPTADQLAITIHSQFPNQSDDLLVLISLCRQYQWRMEREQDVLATS